MPIMQVDLRQPAPSVKDDFVGTKFYCPHALADDK